MNDTDFDSPDGATSPLVAACAAAFGPNGALGQADDRYTPRVQQWQMARAVACAIDEREAVVVEAGTGVGKTFAYLVPALLSGRKTLVSTATKSLQDQLFLRDLPRLLSALALPLTHALLKGRSSYLCPHRLKSARHDAAAFDRFTARALARIETWAQGTRTGDLAEVPGMDERNSVLPLVTSTRENCLGAECPEVGQCHVMRARREALAADLVVVNHHLFFADLSLKDSGVAELLPAAEVLIFDEAHQLAEAGVNFLGEHLSSAALNDFGRDLLATGLQQARGMGEWQKCAAALDLATRNLRLASALGWEDTRVVIKRAWAQVGTHEAFVAALAQLKQQLGVAHDALTAVDGLSPDLQRLAERATELCAVCDTFAREAPLGQVRWLDVGPGHVRLTQSPLDIGEAMQSELADGQRAWVFTSATLGDDDALTWFTAQSGLQDARTLKVGSPFPYRQHARVYVPVPFPAPKEEHHPEAVAALAGRLAEGLGGRTFVLTTTLKALRRIAQALESAKPSADGRPLRILQQGQASKRDILQQFLADPHAILVGSQSFWEGIDVPGDALQCVVIDKLPFPPPNDPLVEARVQRLEREGRSAFNDYFVAEAAISLKQGAGRLIRSETDTGLLVIADPRVRSMSYGRRLLEALPEMPLLTSEADALAWVEGLRGDRALQAKEQLAPGDWPF